ncbi:hypothetical protein BMS3Bbin16_01211 [archaeon BMS3Bbin16]|nr:hypothetical protein BMS3Bbin16_01211 [archaeon BMS3Bbin16]
MSFQPSGLPGSIEKKEGIKRIMKAIPRNIGKIVKNVTYKSRRSSAVLTFKLPSLKNFDHKIYDKIRVAII